MDLSKFDYDEWRHAYPITVDFIDEWLTDPKRCLWDVDTLDILFWKEIKISHFKEAVLSSLIKDHCDIDWDDELFALLAIVVEKSSQSSANIFRDAMVTRLFDSYKERIGYMLDQCLLKITHEREEREKTGHLDDWKYNPANWATT